MTDAITHLLEIVKITARYLVLTARSLASMNLYSIPILGGLIFLAQLSPKRNMRSSSEYEVGRSGLIVARTQKEDGK